MFFISLIQFTAFPSRDDALIAQNNNTNLIVSASGSIGFYFNRKCHLTYPNATIISDKKSDWCSNIAPSRDESPWISFSFHEKQMKLRGYSVRNGCCYYSCCCTQDKGIIDYECCCRLYSFSLQGSNDNHTWNVIHRIEKHTTFYFCKYELYEFPETIPYKYVRLIMDEPYPGCKRCMAINQIELYGNVINSEFAEPFESDNEESISIIGKINRRV